MKDLMYNLDINFLQSFVKKIIHERRTLDKRPDHTLLDSLIDADFIDEEEVDMINYYFTRFPFKFRFINIKYKIFFQLVDQCLTLLIGGFHTVGSSKYNLYELP